MLNKLIYVLLLLCFTFTFGQTKVSGIVYDDLKQPLPFANIYFKGEKIGISSDVNGVFTIESPKDYSVLVVKYAGFQDNEITLSKSIVSDLKIYMSGVKQLQEVMVVVKPKKHLAKDKNPAYRILKEIWKNKKKSRLSLVDSYEYTKYSSVANGLSNLDSVFLKKILGNQYGKVISIAEQKPNQKNYIIPTYLREVNEKVYGNNKTHQERIDILAERVTGLADKGFVMEKIANFIKPFDIYDDDIEVLNKIFVSPLSSRGYSQYEYVLKDSLQEGNRKMYEIYYFPRNSQDMLFQGNFKVDAKSYAITEIYLRNNAKVNLNFVRNLAIEKTYTIQENEVYLPEKEMYEGDFTILSKGDGEKGMYLKKNILYSDYVFNQPKEVFFYDQKIVQTKTKQFEKEDGYWSELNTRQAGVNNVRTIITDLGGNKRIKHVTNLLTILSSGYLPLYKGVQLGSIYQTLSNNDIEGIRLKAGLRTFKTANDLFRVNGYLAYGTKDEAFKYGASARYLINAAPRITVGAGYIKDNLQLSSVGIEESELISYGPNTNIIIARGQNYSLTNTQKAVFSTDFQPTNNLKLNVFTFYRNMLSASESKFSIGYQYPSEVLQNKVSDFAVGLGVFYTPKRDVYGFGVDQSYTGRLYASLGLKYTHGLKGVGGSMFTYDKLQVQYKKPLKLSNFGVLRLDFEASKVFQTLPLPLLVPVVVNQSFSISNNGFSLLDYYDMVTDKYVSAKFEHHFNGYIFNRIPLLKKIKLREVLFYKTVIGGITNANVAINKSSIIYNPPVKPYSEYGFGIENIGLGNFKPFRVDFIWRSSFTDLNGNEPPRFGVRFGFFPEF